MSPRRYRSQIRDTLNSGEFLYTLEHVPHERGESDAQNLDALAREAEKVGQDPRVKGVNIGDRVKSLDSLDTVECGRICAEASGKQPLLHLAGKNLEPREARAVYERAVGYGLDTMLIVSGDGLPREPDQARIRYHDSVVGITDVKSIAPDAVVAAAVSPFKYREEELLNQYLKMAKKYFAGADYFITNCGWDMRKFQELIWYRDARGFGFPVVANLLLPTRGWARGINRGRLPGVFLSDDLMASIEAEYRDPRAGRAAAMRRLALQIVGVRHMGYAGVQLSGVETYNDICEAIESADFVARELPSFEDWQEAWTEAHRMRHGRAADFAPANALYLYGDEAPERNSLDGPPILTGATASADALKKARRLDALDRKIFHEDSLGAKVVGPICKALDGPVLRTVEHAVKKPVLGCEMCGFCRIPHLSYICPETCPKGLANGPCSGTDDNVCEFKDRECIHNAKYRIAKAGGRLSELETELIPAVEATRGTSSWANKFRGSVPAVQRLQPKAGKTG